MKNRIKAILASPLVWNSAKISGSNVIMYMLPLIVTPILTRLYTPEAFGEWGVFSSFVAIVNIGLFLGFENVIIQAKEEEVPHILKICVITSICVIAGIALFFLGGLKDEVTFFTDFPVPYILFIYLLLYAAYTIFYNLANRYEQYYAISFSNIIQGGGQALFRIILAFVCLTTINGLILGTTIALGLTAFFIFFILVREKLLKHFSKYNILITKQLISKYRNFPLYDAPASLLSFAAFNLPIIILSFFFSRTDIGCFSIILQLLLMPMSLVGSAMGKVYYQRISSNTDTAIATTEEMLKILAVISILPLLFIACGGDKLITLFLGSQWDSAGNVALCLALWSFPTILTQPVLPLFRVKNKQRTLLFFDTLYFISSIGSILLTCSFVHNMLLTLTIYATCCFVVKFALFIHILYLGKISIKQFKNHILLWGLSIIILIVRLTELT